MSMADLIPGLSFFEIERPNEKTIMNREHRKMMKVKRNSLKFF